MDVCRLHDEDIKKKTLFGLSEYAFKHKKNKDFREFLETMIPWLHRAELEIGPDYVKMYIHYVIDVFQQGDYSLFAEKIKQHSSKGQEKKAMTIAEQLKQLGKQEAMTMAEQRIQRGKQECIQQGMRQGKIAEKREIAEKMLLRGEFSAEVIASITGLTIAEINAIQEVVQH